MRKYIQDDEHSRYLCSIVSQGITDVEWHSSRHGLIVERDLVADLLSLDSPIKWLHRPEPTGKFYIFSGSTIVVQEELVYYK